MKNNYKIKLIINNDYYFFDCKKYKYISLINNYNLFIYSINNIIKNNMFWFKFQPLYGKKEQNCLSYQLTLCYNIKKSNKKR